MAYIFRFIFFFSFINANLVFCQNQGVVTDDQNIPLDNVNVFFVDQKILLELAEKDTTIEVSEKEVNQALDQQVDNILLQAGGKKEAEKMLGQSIKSFRSEFWFDMRDKMVSERFQQKKLNNITTNKNAVPNDPQSPFVTSGIRLGTAAVTTRGFGKAEIETLSNWICDIALDLENTKQINAIKEQVVTMCKRFPVYK